MALRFSLAISTGFLLAFSTGLSPAAESVEVEKPGLAGIQLVTDATSIAPGETITVGLVIKHLPGFHTYWKGPGIVGVATNFDWKLPPGFSAGETQWPAPQLTKMAGITAYGFESDTCLLVPITAAKDLTGKETTLRVRCGWMACARSCHPSWEDFSLIIPVNLTGKSDPKDPKWTKVFDESRRRFPLPAPDNWKLSLQNHTTDSFSLTLQVPGPLPTPLDRFYFFSHDLQVNSDEPQKVSTDTATNSLSIKLVRPEYAPENPEMVSGVLFHPSGWPGLDTRWVEVSVPWESKTGGKNE